LSKSSIEVHTTGMGNRLARTSALIQQGIEQGLHLGAQLYVSQRSAVVADIAIGESRDGQPMTSDTINLWMSSVKPVAAVAIAQLWEKARLDLDDRVAQHISEFGARGKDRITIRHLLTHTAGIRAVIGMSRNDSYDQTIARICEAPLEPRWTPGRTAGYHTQTSWFILAEIVRRRDGRPLDVYVRREIFEPLGMNDSWVGMPPASYREYGRRIGFMYDTSGGEARPAPGANSEEDAAALRPASNGRGPIRELGRFYEMLLHKGSAAGPAGKRILRPQTVEAIVSPHRVGMFDLTFKHQLDCALGFITNSNHYGAESVPYGYGPHAGPRTFGHSGHQSSCAFCDPDEQLVVAWVCNGMPGEERHSIRQREINAAIYEDLGQVGLSSESQAQPIASWAAE
jgi:CubicO group peptidase (beta-lactamase class C family)